MIEELQCEKLLHQNLLLRPLREVANSGRAAKKNILTWQELLQVAKSDGSSFRNCTGSNLQVFFRAPAKLVGFPAQNTPRCASLGTLISCPVVKNDLAKLNNRGDRRDPLGTPYITCLTSDVETPSSFYLPGAIGPTEGQSQTQQQHL